jgi:ribosomal-protein-alanine N-acetyltransferase
MIRRPTKNDNIKRVAKILYKTDSFLFPFLFGHGTSAFNKIEGLIKKEYNSFSYKYIHVKIINNQIVGLVNYYHPKDIDKRKESDDYQGVLSNYEKVLLLFKQLLLRFLDNKREIDGLYIQAISVSNQYRSKGFGTELLNYTLAKSRDKAFNSIWLDVDIKNTRAIQLYKRLSFNEVSKRMIIPLCIEGVLRMRKTVVI